jgi:hypothetical protein
MSIVVPAAGEAVDDCHGPKSGPDFDKVPLAAVQEHDANDRPEIYEQPDDADHHGR